MPAWVDTELAAKLLASQLYILLDIDGVLWSGSKVIPRVPETLNYLRSQGKRLRFLSNNASLSRQQLLKAFEKHGIHGVSEKEVYNSGYAAALRLSHLLGKLTRDGGQERPLVHGNLFVIGEQGLHDELRQVLAPGYITYGMELHDPEKAGGFDAQRTSSAWSEPVLPAPLQGPLPRGGRNHCRAQPGAAEAGRISLSDLNPAAVVVGLDLHFNMLKLAYAGIILQGPPRLGTPTGGAPAPRPLFVATNEDPQIPIGAENILMPGAGCMVRSLATVSGREPDVVCGKPKTDMAAALFAAEGIQDAKTSCLMIGDRLTTDVAFGNASGCRTMLVLSGVEGVGHVEEAERQHQSELLPDYLATSIACFLP